MSTAAASSVHDAVRLLLDAIAPHDDLEAEHRDEALRWVASTSDLFRRQSRPTLPRQHLVSYFLLVDSDAEVVLLGDHIKSGLWLPSGGHVEPGEHPADTVRRECREELAIDATFHPILGATPLFVTVTDTVGDDPHRDVSLWYVLEVSRSTTLVPDPGEYRDVRWWGTADLGVADKTQFDPYMDRMLDKVRSTIWSRSS